MKTNLFKEKELNLLSHVGFNIHEDNLVFGKNNKQVDDNLFEQLKELTVALSIQISIKHSISDTGNTKYKRNDRFNTYPMFIWIDIIRKENPTVNLKDLLFILRGLIAFQDKNKKFSDKIHHKFNESVKCTPNLNDEWISRITRSHSW